MNLSHLHFQQWTHRFGVSATLDNLPWLQLGPIPWATYPLLGTSCKAFSLPRKTAPVIRPNAHQAPPPFPLALRPFQRHQRKHILLPLPHPSRYHALGTAYAPTAAHTNPPQVGPSLSTTPPPVTRGRMRAQFPLPHGPPRKKDLRPPKGFSLKNPMFWLILELQSVARWTHKIILVMKGKYIMDGSDCVFV